MTCIFFINKRDDFQRDGITQGLGMQCTEADAQKKQDE